MSDYLGKDIFKLGFGLMRLPKKADRSMDMEQICKMVDLFLAAGGTYFDTAYVYDRGDSERAAKEALVDRYPRESYQLVTKCCAWMSGETEESAKNQIKESLERTGAGYFDYYLLHALQSDNYKKYEEYHLWEHVRELKEQGLVRHIGISFHSTPELLEEILIAHPEIELVQLQLNYMDMENPEVEGRACLDIAVKYGKSVTVMEPLKGGALADPPQVVQDVFKAADPDMSCASWGIRYAASLDNIVMVLSGMSTLGQMEDNLSYMRDFRPLTEAEYAVIEKAKEAFESVPTIACTACHYCTDGCPMQIPIPEIFKARNTMLKFNSLSNGKWEYREATDGKAKASDCIECGQCENACPQQLAVMTYLKDCAAAFE